MAVTVTGLTQIATPAPTPSYSGVGSGVRQALAIVGGAVDTNQTIRREARFIERREPKPFTTIDRVEVRTRAPNEAEKPAAPEPKSEPPEFRKLALTGQPAAERELRRGEFLDVEA
ncbi:MAG: hypothetical protein FJX60_00435 [Alphaproteobacteria bacterium]|nr:hypothetical protein [Alphaproteobacteria bacterium]